MKAFFKKPSGFTLKREGIFKNAFTFYIKHVPHKSRKNGKIEYLYPNDRDTFLLEKRTIEGDFILQCAEKCAYLADLSEFLTKSQKMSKKSQIAVDGIAFAYYNLCVLERETRTEKCP